MEFLGFFSFQSLPKSTELKSLGKDPWCLIFLPSSSNDPFVEVQNPIYMSSPNPLCSMHSCAYQWEFFLTIKLLVVYKLA